MDATRTTKMASFRDMFFSAKPTLLFPSLEGLGVGWGMGARNNPPPAPPGRGVPGSRERFPKWFLAAIFLVIIAIEGPVQALLDLRSEGRPQVLDFLSQAPTQDNLRTFESALEDNAWSAEAVRPAMQYFRYALGEDLGAKALAGKDDWLFYRAGAEFLMQPWPHAVEGGGTDDPLGAIVDFRDTLAQRDIALLVVIAPGKASIYPDKLSARIAETDERIYGHARAFLDRLAEASVPTVDLFARYATAREGHEAPLYLERDTHWSPEGLRLAAKAVAERVIKEGWIPNGTLEYAIQPVEVSRVGDVLRMADSPYITARFAPESIACAQVTDPATGQPYADEAEAPPVLVLGDSFLRIYQSDAPGSAGFIAHLARELKQPVASIVSDGGASTLVRQELARHPELLHGKKLVIWEFVERDLRFGTEGWQKVKLGD